MAHLTQILLQTTIPFTADDWHVGRFSRLAEHLGSLPGVEVTARDLHRDATGVDRVLGGLADSSFDQLWLFAVDVGDGLVAEECAGIAGFRSRSGGVLAARDHQDLGCSLRGVPGIGSAHHFHSVNPDPLEENREIDDVETPYIVWPNYHSGRNGDLQPVDVIAPAHALMRHEGAPGGVVAWLPAHPHEGSVSAPPDDADARVIARGRSTTTGRSFNLVVAGDPHEGGRWIAESSFHHLADYNWDPAAGAPSFVSEPPGDGIARAPQLLDHVRAYVVNAAGWLSR